MQVTHKGEVFATTLPPTPGASEDEEEGVQRPDITLPPEVEGAKWEDTTACPGPQYCDTPDYGVYYVEADETFFLDLGDDVVWYEEIVDEGP
jgi:hypothetical protein